MEFNLRSPLIEWRTIPDQLGYDRHCANLLNSIRFIYLFIYSLDERCTGIRQLVDTFEHTITHSIEFINYNGAMIVLNAHKFVVFLVGPLRNSEKLKLATKI